MGLHSQNPVNSPPLTLPCVLHTQSLDSLGNWEKNGTVGYVFMTVMRPQVVSPILNLGNHQVRAGNPQRTARSKGACNNQIQVTDRTLQQQQNYDFFL